MGDLMDMLDFEMGYMNTKDCDKEIKKRDDAWKRKLDDLVRQSVLKDQASKAKVEAMRKRVIEACNEHIKKIEQNVKKAYNIRIAAMLNNLNQKHNERMKAMMNENNKLKAENAKLTEAVSRTAAAMTLSGMPRKRRRPGFRDFGNPLMW